MGIDVTVTMLLTVLAVLLGIVGYLLGLKDGRADARNGADGAARERNRQVAVLVESLPVPIAITDAQGAVVVASSGFTSDVLEDGRIVSDEILDIIGGVSENRDASTRRFTSAGGVHYSVTVAPVDEALYAVIGLDVTDQVRFERMRRDFMSNVSHELKTPTGAIALMAETIEDCADDPDTVRHFAGRISGEAMRLSDMIVKLIELTKAERLVADTASAPLDVNEVIEQAVNDVAVQSQDAGVDVIVRCEGSPQVRITAAEFRSAVRNLVENAIHYSPRGEHVTVTSQIVTDDDSKGKVTIRVIDNGCGIPAASLPRIFERFYRVDAGRSRDSGGTGIGLAIVRQVVEEAGGTVGVWSRPGSGSTFTIALPIVTDVSGTQNSDAEGASAEKTEEKEKD